MNGYNVLSDNQKQSLATSQGNATSTQKATETSDLSNQLSQLALQLAMATLK